MTRKIPFFILLALLMLCVTDVCAKSQKFFNLTADEVKIDSVLPYFTYTAPLGGAWADSVYTVSIEYPEFIEMGDADAARYRKLCSKPAGAMPAVETRVVVERRRGHLEVAFVPIVERGGRLMKLVSFMLDVKSSPKARAKAATRTADAAKPADRYAAHSVLAEGTWAKIRVPETGVYEITDALARRAGFSDLSRVKVYGYGGALQNAVLTEEDLVKYDDLKEVPTCMVDAARATTIQTTVITSSPRATASRSRLTPRPS